VTHTHTQTLINVYLSVGSVLAFRSHAWTHQLKHDVIDVTSTKQTAVFQFQSVWFHNSNIDDDINMSSEMKGRHNASRVCVCVCVCVCC